VVVDQEQTPRWVSSSRMMKMYDVVVVKVTITMMMLVMMKWLMDWPRQ
jgi:hypothetical protein